MVDSVANTSLIPQIYAKSLWAEAMKMAFISKFMGEGEGFVIQKKTDLAAVKGTQFNFGLSMLMTNDGVYGDNEMEGNEELLVDHTDSITVDQIRNAFRLTGRIEEKKASYDLRQTAKERLRDWLADRLDRAAMNHLCGNTGEDFPAAGLSPSSGRDLYGGDATSEATIDSADTFTANLINKAKVFALTTSPLIRPVKVDGKDFFVLFLHPFQAISLRNDPDWQNSHYFAAETGMSNPIFSGSMGIYNGVVVHEHNRVYQVDTMGSGSDQPGARAPFCGRQALLFAEGAGPTWDEKTFDFGNKYGAATGKICGFKKTVFNSEDCAVLTISTYAESVS